MRANMTALDLMEVLGEAQRENSPLTFNRQRPVIKYIDTNYDLRTGTVFSITFRGFGGKFVNFNTCNQNIENPKSLKDRCMYYLKTGEIT